ncbi:MAG: hypothetical protein HOP02_11145 [Methylococcaceae bacterium]|nr:hypothetical protein [Methylococcaceae bacterium]
MIIAGEHCLRDKAQDQLDLPEDANHPDPAAYQAERRQLQLAYIDQLKAQNHLYHPAANDTKLENIVLKLRDELAILHEQWTAWLKQDGEFKADTLSHLRRLFKWVILPCLLLLLIAGGGWWGYQQLYKNIEQVSSINTEKIRAHLQETIAETHRRELAAAAQSPDWQQRQRLQNAAEAAHTQRLSKIDELATAFADIEGRGTATTVFQELTRILSEQGVDQAIAYVASQRATILQSVRSRATAVHAHNRADLQPLLQTAALQESKGQPAEARSLYTEVLSIEPDWPEALDGYFWFLLAQGDSATTHTTLADALRDYTEAQRIAQRLNASDPSNNGWQRDVAVAQGKLVEADKAYRDGLKIATKLAVVDASNSKWQRDRDLSIFYNKLGNVAMAQGKLDEAAKAYGDGLVIAVKLAVVGASKLKWQRDPWVFYDKLGNVAMAQGELEEAAKAYGDGLEIATKLAAGDASNSQWQRDLSVSYDNLGDVAVAQGKLVEAAKAYGDGLMIWTKLAAGDASNSEWQRDLSIAYEKLGNLAERRKQSQQAKSYWQQVIKILSDIDQHGLHLSPEDRKVLAQLRQKVAAKP